METQWTRRRFVGTLVVVIAGMILWLAGCGDPLRGGSAQSPATSPPTSAPVVSVNVAYGSSVLAALEKAKPTVTKQTNFGPEVVEIDGRKAVKSATKTEGFVMLIDGLSATRSLDQIPFITPGKHTIEVRFVPHGVRGEDVKENILVVIATVQ